MSESAKLSPLIVENLPLPNFGELSLYSQRNFALAIESIVYDFFKVRRPLLKVEQGWHESTAIQFWAVNGFRPDDER
ncbi:MAG: hypothetical protein ABS921_10075 [Psychrobacter alimentarius]